MNENFNEWMNENYILQGAHKSLQMYDQINLLRLAKT